MAAPPGELHFASCPFDNLSDELVCLILKRAAVKSYLGGACDLRMEDSEEIWVSAREVNQFKTVCQRFSKLNLETTAGSHVVWEFHKGDTMTGVNALLQTGKHTRGLALHHKPWGVFEGKELQGSASIELVVGTLTRATNLRKFVLSCSEKRQTREAAKCLFTLLSQKPLSVLRLLDMGFDFVEPLKHKADAFGCLKDVQIHSARISDAFLQTLISQAPKLESLSLMNCNGLEEPVFEARHLKVLALNLSIYDRVSSVCVQAPQLSRLEGLPGVRRLRMDAPKLKQLSLNGPIDSMESPQRKFEVSDLTLKGYSWCLSQALEAVRQFGASKSLCFGMDSWHEDSEPLHLATFLPKLPSTLTSLTLGQVTLMLYSIHTSGEALRNLRFVFLKEADLSVCESEDFDMVALILRCCPKLERVTLDLDNISKPIDGLVCRVMQLQKEFPDIEWECREPLQFISSGLIQEAAGSPQKLRELVDGVCEFAE